MKNIFYAVYACDTDRHGLTCGTETILRLEKLVSVLQISPGIRKYALFGAGKSKNNPKYALSVLMKGHLSHLCHRMNVETPHMVGPLRQAWGSLDESIQIRNNLRGFGIKEITVISSSYHIPRLKVIWKLIAPEIRVTFVSVKVKRKLIDYAEPAKIIWAYIKFLLYKAKIKESYLFQN